MGPERWSMVTFDIDGTLTLGHGWRFIAERFGRVREYERTTAEYVSGAIGEDAHLANLLKLAVGHTVAEVESVLAETPRVKAIETTVRGLRRRGIRTALLTHNPPYVCGWYSRAFGFELYEGCRVREPVNGRIGAPGRVHADKVGSLARLLDRSGATPDRVAHVGDSGSDLEVFELVGAGIALNSRNREVRAGADAVVDSEDLRDVLVALDRLGGRNPSGHTT